MPAVGWRETVYRWLDHGKPPPPPDPDERVEVAVLSLPEAAMLTAELEGRGLATRTFPAVNLITRSMTNGAVTVPRRQLAEAQEAYEDWLRLHGRRPPPPPWPRIVGGNWP
jgi:hypothetical protein